MKGGFANVWSKPVQVYIRAGGCYWGYCLHIYLD